MSGNTIHSRYLKSILVVLVAIAVSWVFFSVRKTKKDVDQKAEVFQKAFLQRDSQVEQFLADFISRVTIINDSVFPDQVLLDMLEADFERCGIVYMVFDKDDQPVFWSHNAVPFMPDMAPEKKAGTILLQNGWYIFHSQAENDLVFYAFGIVKHEFKYQNRFLVNEFHEDLHVSQEVFTLIDKVREGIPVYDKSGNYAFSLVLRREAALADTILIFLLLSLALAIAAYVIFILASFRYFSALYCQGNKPLGLLGFAATMIAFRFILFLANAPAVFYDGRLFSPALYASSWLLPSLGDLFLNTVFVSIISFFFYFHLRSPAKNFKAGKWTKYLLVVILFAVIYLISGLCIDLIESLVINSSLNLNINFIFNLEIFNLVGFLIIGFIFFSFFFLTIFIGRIIQNIIPNKLLIWAFFGLSFILFIFLQSITHGFNPLQGILFLTAIIVFEMEKGVEFSNPGFTSMITALFLFSIVSTLAIHRFNNQKEIEKRRSFAMRMASEQDPVAEFIFMEMENTLYNDHQLRNLVIRDPQDQAAIYRYLQHHYFYDFWAKYDIQITICSPEDNLLIRPYNIEVDCFGFFEDIIRMFGKSTLSDNLIYLDNNTGRNSYIAKIPVRVGDTEAILYNIYIEFDSKFVPRDMGFPELLIDQDINISYDFINYSYATYKDGNLSNKFGPFNYSININTYGRFDEQFSEFEFDDYHHLVYHKDSDLKIIISRPKQTLLEKTAPFSYLFVLMFLFITIFWMVATDRKFRGMFKMNFKRRVQFSMIGIVIASLVTIGGASTWFIYKIYQNKNISIISEKSHSILVEMEHYLAEESDIHGEEWSFYLSDILLRFSNVFFTDINLYDPQGFLLASSRPKVFEEGLVSKKMNSLAFGKLRTFQKSQHIHSENIGELEFLSAYVPLRNNQNQLLAYINLPYFAKQSELRNEVAYFLVAFINIYLLLMVVAILWAIIISNHITKPLQLIREHMSGIKLGRSNRKIQWERMDEIGSLIGEYNRMIDELAVSADLLARGERETAWREMAKQVAHEIKNPLTPMRLSVQYLEKAWKDKDPNWDERLTRFSKIMVEQIDNLSVIAGAFSDFAKMPAGDNTSIDLRDFIPEVADLYKDFEKLNLTLHFDPDDKPLMVYADRNQLLRVFNNLIKNSLQSYDKDQTAVIEIYCNRGGDWVTIEVRDYGMGIPEEQKKNIFSPYFTTKTGGMGLGLSMVKGIITNLNGRVYFNSEQGKGTSFFLVIPAILQDQQSG
jgi:two-component system, NtrC family, nitrogen regulation sensor histidine kinase NtrY